MSSKLRIRRAGMALLWVSLLSFGAAAASDEERATARSLANQGIAAYKEKRFGEAADLFQRAESLVHSPVHLLYLGRSLVATGKLVRAQEAYLKATRDELGASSPAAFVRAVDEANTELDNLRPRLAQLLVTLTGLSAGETAEVQVDGEPMAPAMVGVPVPMDPGQHRVEAKAARHLPAWRKISMAEGQTEKVSLTLELDPDAAVPEPSKTDAPEGGTNPAPAGKNKAAAQGGNSIFLFTSLGALAIGVGGAGLGTYYIVRSQQDSADAESKFQVCPQVPMTDLRDCDKDQVAEIAQLDSNARKYRREAIAPYIAGGVGLLLGTTLLILYANSANSQTASSGLHVVPWIGTNSAGLSGTW